MPQLIVSLTTIPPRAGHLETTIRSIQEQSLTPDAIELNLPKSYSRRGFAPFEMRDLPSGCDVFWVDQDLGPAAKVCQQLRDTGVQIRGSYIAMMTNDMTHSGWSGLCGCRRQILAR